MAQRQDHFLLKGGLDLVTSPLAISKGRMLSVKNYEPTEGGYRRVGGYERFDGRPAPSDATYWIMQFENAASAAAPDDEIAGADTGATATVLVTVPESVTAGYYVLADLVGEFRAGETINVGANPKGIVAASSAEGAAGTLAFDSEYRASAARRRRALIGAVPGSGPIRGVWAYKNEVYAIRDTVDGTAAAMFKATASGWLQQGTGEYFEIGGGRLEPIVGETIRGATSGATAQVLAVRVLSGDWSSSNMSAVITVSTPDRQFRATEDVQVERDSTYRTAGHKTGPSIVLALPPGGRYDFRNHNFSGRAEGQHMFGTNGVGRAFRWDGLGLQFIETGLTDELDKPTHLAIQSNHLLLSYRGGSIQNSATGNPLNWEAGEGAAEIATGQEILGMVEGVGFGNTLILGLNTIQALYGQDKESWELRTHSGEQTGAVEWTAQLIGAPIYMDNRGLRSVETTERYGNFLIGALTYYVQPWLEAARRLGRRPIASIRVRSGDLYRLFMDSGQGLSVYFGRGDPECALIEYPDKVRCAYSFEAEQGQERLFFGSDDGWVFEAEKGTSFDGEDIEAFLRLPYNHAGSPSHEIRFHKAALQVDTEGRTEIRVGASFDYGDAEGSFLAPGEVLSGGGGLAHLFDIQSIVEGGGGLWSEVTWGDFFWQSQESAAATFHFSGIGANVSLLVASRSAEERSHTITGVTMHYSNRRLRR